MSENLPAKEAQVLTLRPRRPVDKPASPTRASGKFAGSGPGLAPGAAHPKAREFSKADLEDVRRNVLAARTICRVVALAVAAQLDHSVVFENPAASRWLSALEEACDRLTPVADTMVSTLNSPPCNWWTSQNLLEALGAALWHGHGPDHDDDLCHEELASFLGVAIESLDALLLECEAAA